MPKFAEVTVLLTVEFEDDGENDLRDQAMDAVRDVLGGGWGPGQIDDVVDTIEVTAVRDTQAPA